MSLPMSPELTSSCLEIIEELLTHPISEIFAYPVDPELDGVPDYLEKIPNPMDLGTVLKKLKAGEYSDLAAFTSDVNLIWENASTYNGTASVHAIMAEELSRIFKKSLMKIDQLTHEEWIAEYQKAQTALYSVFRNQPRPLDSENLTPEMEMLVPERRGARSYLLPEDVLLFEKAFKLVEDSAHMDKILQILNENEPSVDTTEEEIHVNLSALSQRSLRLMKNLASEIKEMPNNSSTPEMNSI